jgi:hypothetical protein
MLDFFYWTFNIQYIKKLKKYQTCQRDSKKNQASKDIIYTNQGNKERTGSNQKPSFEEGQTIHKLKENGQMDKQ